MPTGRFSLEKLPYVGPAGKPALPAMAGAKAEFWEKCAHMQEAAFSSKKSPYVVPVGRTGRDVPPRPANSITLATICQAFFQKNKKK